MSTLAIVLAIFSIAVEHDKGDIWPFLGLAANAIGVGIAGGWLPA